METMLTAAKAAKYQVSCLTTEAKNAALEAMAAALEAEQDAILAANALDLEAARGTVSDVMLDRLLLTPARIAGMAQGIREVAQLPDPVKELHSSSLRELSFYIHFCFRASPGLLPRASRRI